MYKYKFCPNCGKNFKKVSEIFYHCPNCDFRIFLSPKPAAGAIIENCDGAILLLTRGKDPRKGYLGLPGGFVDAGETAEECLTREIEEELGITIKQFKYLGSFTSVYPLKGVDYKVIDNIYTARLPTNSKIKLSEESHSIIFTKPSEIDFDQIAFDDARKALKKYLNVQN